MSNLVALNEKKPSSWDRFKNTEKYGREEYTYKKNLLTVDDITEDNFNLIGNNLNLYLAYPDLFLDTITPKDSNFKLYFYQRIYLRVAMRFRYVFSTFTRAFSKSFLSILAMILRAIFLPGSKLFICAEVKEQAAKIAKEKILEIFEIWPLLQNETYLGHKRAPKGMGCSMAKDYVELWFKNGSNFQVVGMANSSRGGRRHAGVIEEVRDIDATILNEVILPLMNITRRSKGGQVNFDEPHQAQLFVTTADNKGTFAYDKLIEILAMSVIKPHDYFAWGGTYDIPVMHGLLDKKYIEEIKFSDTYEDSSFLREYLSVWPGGGGSSFFNYDKMSSHRKVVRAEEQYTTSANDEMFYLMSVDVARLRAETVITIFKVLPSNGQYRKKVVNIYVLKEMHFLDQTVILKQLLDKFKAKEMVIDGSGLGVGLLDFMVMENEDKDGNIYPAIGVINDEDYLKKQPKRAPKQIYVIKSSGKATDIHLNASNHISAGKVDFLITEREAKARLAEQKRINTMYKQDKINYVQPYKNTTVLIEEICNWRQKASANKIQLEKINHSKSHDKFSSFEYGLYRLDMLESEYMERFNKNKGGVRSMIFVN